MEREFPFGAFLPEKKTEPPFQLFRGFRKFTTGTGDQKSLVPFTFQPDFSFCKW